MNVIMMMIIIRGGWNEGEGSWARADAGSTG